MVVGLLLLFCYLYVILCRVCDTCHAQPLFLTVLLFCSTCDSVFTGNVPAQGSLFDCRSINGSLSLSMQQNQTVN